MIKKLLFLFILFIFIIACTPADNKLTTAISPARDLTGTWEGTAKWKNNVANPACSYEGTIRFNLQQNENSIQGTWQTTITKIIPAEWNDNEVPCGNIGLNPAANLQGALSSSSVRFTSAPTEFSATFTTDLLKGGFKSCPDQICSDGGRAVGAIGEFSAVRK